MKPSDCNSIGDVLSLDSSHLIVGKWSILIQHDGAVVIVEQRIGEKPTGSMVIPRRTFQRLADWYETEQTTPPKPG